MKAYFEDDHEEDWAEGKSGSFTWDEFVDPDEAFPAHINCRCSPYGKSPLQSIRDEVEKQAHLALVLLQAGWK